MKGRLIDIDKDIQTRKYIVSLSLDDIGNLEELREKDLDIKIKQYREKRSLDANNYAWVLMDKIARHKDVNTTSEEVYEKMLCDYGYPLYDEDERPVMITLAENVDVSKIDIHVKWIGKGHVDGKIFNHYKVIRGSSTYNTAEMSTFIQGIVNEAKELGIETMTPAEIQRMVSLWKA